MDARVPLLDGSEAVYVNFDNAASTPCLRRVLRRVGGFLDYYASIHRGTGFKSRLSTYAYEEARRLVGDFVGADPLAHQVIFGKNATEAVNKLSYRLRFPPEAVVICTEMEHHSNDLPWRNRARVLHAPVNPADGSLDLDRLEQLIAQNRKNLFLVAVTGASNVTGLINPLQEIAAWTHRAGGVFMVDGAQLLPHRPLRLGAPQGERSIDFLVFSAHKMYAPFGTGVLVARRDLLDRNVPPEYTGGGTVKVVTLDRVVWAGEPFVDEAGSPNAVGAIALAEALQFFRETGYDRLERIETDLARRLLLGLRRFPDIELLGPKGDFDAGKRLAVIPLQIRNMPHALAAAILAYEFGIGVRYGCFCAHPYIKKLLGVSGSREEKLIGDILRDDRGDIPGALRVSFGFYNRAAEVARLLAALEAIVNRSFHGHYALDRERGEYSPTGYREPFERYFRQ